MKDFEGFKQTINKHRKILKKKYGVKEIGIFGSYIRGKTRKNSDLDILVDFDRNIDLLQFVNLENHLSDILGVKVDLVMKDALKPRIGRHILTEVIYI